MHHEIGKVKLQMLIFTTYVHTPETREAIVFTGDPLSQSRIA